MRVFLFSYVACSPIAGYVLLIPEVFQDHTQQRTTVGRTPLDEWSARRRHPYLATHNTHNRQTSMAPAGFEPTISAGERPQTHSLDRAATAIGFHASLPNSYFIWYLLWAAECFSLRWKRRCTEDVGLLGCHVDLTGLWIPDVSKEPTALLFKGQTDPRFLSTFSSNVDKFYSPVISSTFSVNFEKTILDNILYVADNSNVSR